MCAYNWCLKYNTLVDPDRSKGFCKLSQGKQVGCVWDEAKCVCLVTREEAIRFHMSRDYEEALELVLK